MWYLDLAQGFVFIGADGFLYHAYYCTSDELWMGAGSRYLWEINEVDVLEVQRAITCTPEGVR